MIVRIVAQVDVIVDHNVRITAIINQVTTSFLTFIVLRRIDYHFNLESIAIIVYLSLLCLSDNDYDDIAILLLCIIQEELLLNDISNRPKIRDEITNIYNHIREEKIIERKKYIIIIKKVRNKYYIILLLFKLIIISSLVDEKE